MTSALVHLGYSLPEGQARKLNFFVPCEKLISTYYENVQKRIAKDTTFDLDGTIKHPIQRMRKI